MYLGRIGLVLCGGVTLKGRLPTNTVWGFGAPYTNTECHRWVWRRGGAALERRPDYIRNWCHDGVHCHSRIATAKSDSAFNGYVVVYPSVGFALKGHKPHEWCTSKRAVKFNVAKPPPCGSLVDFTLKGKSHTSVLPKGEKVGKSRRGPHLSRTFWPYPKERSDEGSKGQPLWLWKNIFWWLGHFRRKWFGFKSQNILAG